MRRSVKISKKNSSRSASWLGLLCFCGCALPAFAASSSPTCALDACKPSHYGGSPVNSHVRVADAMGCCANSSLTHLQLESADCGTMRLRLANGSCAAWPHSDTLDLGQLEEPWETVLSVVQRFSVDPRKPGYWFFGYFSFWVTVFLGTHGKKGDVGKHGNCTDMSPERLPLNVCDLSAVVKLGKEGFQ